MDSTEAPIQFLSQWQPGLVAAVLAQRQPPHCADTRGLQHAYRLYRVCWRERNSNSRARRQTSTADERSAQKPRSSSLAVVHEPWSRTQAEVSVPQCAHLTT